MREAAKQKLLARKCGTHECVCCSANCSHKCLCHTHTHSLTHIYIARGGRVSRLGNALGQGVSAPRRLKQMMQIRFRCPSRERKAKRKISKNFSWHTGNFYLPAATFATPRRQGEGAGGGVGCCRWKLSIRNVNANLMLEKFA